MGLGFKLQYIYCWLCFVREYQAPLYLTDTIVLQNINTIVFNIGMKDEVTLYYQSELDVIQTLIDNEQIWMDVVEEELNLSIEDYISSDLENLPEFQ